VGFDVLTKCKPSTVWCSRERLPAAAAQPAKVRQSCSATDYYYYVNTEELHVLIQLDHQVVPISCTHFGAIEMQI
jgi:hypothetical protein